MHGIKNMLRCKNKKKCGGKVQKIKERKTKNPGFNFSYTDKNGDSLN